MTEHPTDSLSDAHRQLVLRALATAFGPARIDAILPVAGGASGAFPYRVDIGERRYLARIEGPASPLRNPHQYASMRIAAEAGIAPSAHLIDEAARIAIVDFIDEQPLSSFPGGPCELARALGTLRRRVQDTAPFPHFVDYPELVARLWAWVCQTGLFAPGMLDPYTERLARLRETCPRDPARSVSSHNDPVPRNLLFDGTRLWLIDWESACSNDPLVDVAIMLDNLAPSPELEEALIEAWLGRAPDSALMERLASVRALTRLYYAGVLLSASAAAFGPIADDDLAAPTPPELRQMVREGRVGPGTPATKHLLGKMYLGSFLIEAPPPGLAAAV